MEATPLLHQKLAPRPNPRVFLLTCLIIFTFIEIGTYMLLIPQTQIYEDILCKHYYNNKTGSTSPVPDGDCKIAPVQGELAKIRAITASMSAIPGILLSVPYGQLADNPKIGRKMILMFSYIGVLLQVYTELVVCWLSDEKSGGMSLRLVWLAPLWTVLGGGTGVLGAVIFTMITDVVDISQRSTGFIYVSLSLQISQLVAPLISSWIMATSVWLAYIISIVMVTIGLPVLLISLPETVNIRPSESDDSCDLRDNDQEDIIAEDQTPDSDSESDSDPDSTSTLLPEQDSQPTKKNLSGILHDYKFLKDPSILILLSSFCLYWLGRSQMDLLVQYTSTRYGQSISSAGFVLSLNAAISLILFLAILPFISNYLQKKIAARRRFTNTKASAVADLWVLKGSIILLTIGSIAIGAAPILPTMLIGDVIYILGSGFGPVARGLLTMYVDKLHVARLHALVSIVQMFGLLLGSPLLAVLFDRGFAIGKEWTGLPFLGSGVLHLLLCLGIWNVRVPVVADADTA